MSVYIPDHNERAQAFERAAEEAKRELFPELFFEAEEPKVAVCRLCDGPGYHTEKCKLHPSNRWRLSRDEQFRLIASKEKREKPTIALEKERLEQLGVLKDKKKVAAAQSIEGGVTKHEKPVRESR